MSSSFQKIYTKFLLMEMSYQPLVKSSINKSPNKTSIVLNGLENVDGELKCTGNI